MHYSDTIHALLVKHESLECAGLNIPRVFALFPQAQPYSFLARVKILVVDTELGQVFPTDMEYPYL
jgi:hypothetical protein